MKIRDIVEGRINWNALRQADAVMPYLYDSPEARKEGIKPNPREPNIITSINLKEPRRPGETFTPLYTMGKAAWQKYMDDWWRDNKNDPRAKEKVAQIRQAAADAKMPIREFIIMPHTADPMGLIHLPGKGPNNRYGFKNKGNNRANEDTSDEAWELLGQKDPAIRKYVADLGLQNDQASVDKVVPMIDKARQSTINPSQIPQLKNLANKPADPQALRNILKIKGTPQAPEQFAKIMQARDRAEGRSRGYDVGKLINAISTGNYDPPVVLKLPSGNYVIGGRTRLYAALALNKPINVKVLEAAGVGIVTKQNATKDVPVGGEYMNVKKLGLGKGKPKTIGEEWEAFKEKLRP